jgi:hypothetical protein
MPVVVRNRGIEEDVEEPFGGLQGPSVGRDEALPSLEHEQGGAGDRI